VIRESSVRVVSPMSDECGVAAAPNALTRILREWPDAAARAAIVALACILFWLTWAHWGSIQVDCGREVYVPYQILRGKLLYRDLWYPYGPLEPYISALLLKLFGEHLSVLYFLGLSLAIASSLLLFELGRMLAERAVGLTAALALLFQGFGPPYELRKVGGAIFNYVFPYAYATMLGLPLALLCAFFAVRHVLGLDGRNLTMAGLFAGLALVCKQEFGGACYLMLAIVLLMELALRRSPLTLLRGIAEYAPGAGIAAALYGWFFWKLTPGFILFDNWNLFPGSYFMRTQGAHFAAEVGARFVPEELIFLIVDATVAVVLWWRIAKIWAVRVGRLWRCAAITLLAGAVLAARQFAPMLKNVLLALLAFPPGMFFIGCAFIPYVLYELRHDAGDRRLLANAAFGVFALLLAVRVLARLVPSGYTIFYDGPLLLVFIIVVTRCIGAAVPALAAEQRRKLINSLLAAEVVVLGIALIPIGGDRTARLETSWGDIYLESTEAIVARQLIDFISEQNRQGRRVVLLPELPMLYVLTGTAAPSRWYTLTPGFLAPSQGDDYIVELGRAAPDYIILTNRYTPEYREVYFGIDYDQKILKWIERNYRVTRQFGNFRRDGSRVLAALLYERRGANLPAAKVLMPQTVSRPRETEPLQMLAVPLSIREVRGFAL
jgi:hypothetical protein